MKNFCLCIGILLLSSTAWTQQSADFMIQETESLGEGWGGFSDLGFMTHALLTLALATILGAIIAYHPKHRQSTDTLDEVEAPQIYIMYAVIGALIGILVVKYGLVVGFVLFGIGGLIRFRTVLRSASLTGRVILITLIGLTCGLDLPHVAVLATAFGFMLIYILDARVTYQIDIRGVAPEQVIGSAAAYRALLEQTDCRILSEKKNPEKGRVTFIFQSTHKATRGTLEEMMDSAIDEPLKGSVDWQVD